MKKPCVSLWVAGFALLSVMPVCAQQEVRIQDIFELAHVEGVSRIQEKRSQSPSVVDVVTQETIRELGYRNLYDILIRIPGFWPIADINDKLVGVRGVHASSNQKFLLLINGKRFTENLWNLTSLDYNLPLVNVKRVEIIRTPGSAIYGRAALTAVINVITYSGREINGLKAEVSVGDYGYRLLSLTYGYKTENGEVDLWAHGFQSNGQVFDVDASQDGATNRVSGREIVDRFQFPTGSLGARVKSGDWSFNLILGSRHFVQPRAQNSGLYWQDFEKLGHGETQHSTDQYGETVQYLVADLQRDFKVGSWQHSFTADATYSDVKTREIISATRDNDTTGFTSGDLANLNIGRAFEFDLKSYRAGLEYFGHYEFAAQRNLLWGVEAYQTSVIDDRFHSNYDENLVLRSDGNFVESRLGTLDELRTEYLYSAYVELKWDFADRYFLSLGSRYDHHVKGSDYKGDELALRFPAAATDSRRGEVEKDSGQLSPRLALTYQPLENDLLTFKAIYNRSFVAPAYFYRYADPSTSYFGGPWLKAETLDNYIVAMENVFPSGFSAKTLAFVNENRNLLIRDSSVTPAVYTSLGKLGTKGLEMDLSFDKPLGTLWANYAYLVGDRALTDESSERAWIMSNDTIKNFPKHSGSLGVTGRWVKNHLATSLVTTWNRSVFSPLGRGIGRGTVASLGPDYRTDATIRCTPSHYDDFDIRLSIYNIFDRSVLRGGTVSRPIHEAGRWFNVSLVKKL
jgi:iron complex outermembrane receptor protein